MLLRLFLLFTAVPLIELYLLLWLSSVTSSVFTFAVILGTGLVGASLARQQGWQAWRQIQQELSAGRSPAAPMVDGLLILIAGALLITPGILTDTVGFGLLIPLVRSWLRRTVGLWLKARTVVRFQQGPGTSAHRTQSRKAGSDKTVIDAEFVRHPSPDKDRKSQ